jgi:hypothetical protein
MVNIDGNDGVNGLQLSSVMAVGEGVFFYIGSIASDCRFSAF